MYLFSLNALGVSRSTSAHPVRILPVDVDLFIYVNNTMTLGICAEADQLSSEKLAG